MKLQRVVAYIEPEVYREFYKALREEGLTLSGWLRKTMRQFLDNRKR